MDNELLKLYKSFCAIKDRMTSETVTKQTADIIGRFSKVMKITVDVVSKPPKADHSFEQDFKIDSYIPTSQDEVKKSRDQLIKDKSKKKPGPKPKKK